MSTNIFDTRNIIKQTPKMGNRFLLTADKTQLDAIINKSKLKKLSDFAGGHSSVFGSPNASSGSSSSSSAAANTGRPADVLNLSLLSCTIPAFEFEVGDVNRFNDTIKHITKFSPINDMSSVFYDYINGSATSIMLAWQSCIGFKLTGEIGYKSQYTCDMDLYVYGPNRPGYKVNNSTTSTDSEEYETLMQFKIINAFPRSVDIGDFSYDSAEIKKVTVQFGYDMIMPYKNNKRSQSSKVSSNSDFAEDLKVREVNELTTDTDISGNEDAVYSIFINNKYT